MDNGYPLTTEPNALKAMIKPPTVTGRLATALTGQSGVSDVLPDGTISSMPWRKAGVKYAQNEIYLDVIEEVDAIVDRAGQIVSSEVSGIVHANSRLSGIPDLTLTFLDPEVIDDCSFHPCVRMNRYERDRVVSFVPPDGEFELMKYRVTDTVNLPFKVIPNVQEEGQTRVSLPVKVVANFSPKLFASNVVIKIPAPPNTARARIHKPTGSAKWEAQERAVVWRVRRFPGGQESTITAELELAKSTRTKAWSRPPLAIEFQVPMFTASGLHVRFLKVFEKSSYTTTKWVRYITRGGSYQVRV